MHIEPVTPQEIAAVSATGKARKWGEAINALLDARTTGAGIWIEGATTDDGRNLTQTIRRHLNDNEKLRMRTTTREGVRGLTCWIEVVA
jgi:hypothetical protein